MTALMVVHALHVIAGVAWGGGQILVAGALLPALLGGSAPEARRTLDLVGPPIGRLQAAAGGAVLLLGLARGTWLGVVRSVDVAVGTAYGRTFLLAVALTVALSVRGARTERFVEGLFVGDTWHPHARRRVLGHAAADVALTVAVVTCMVAMRFGW